MSSYRNLQALPVTLRHAVIHARTNAYSHALHGAPVAVAVAVAVPADAMHVAERIAVLRTMTLVN